MLNASKKVCWILSGKFYWDAHRLTAVSSGMISYRSCFQFLPLPAAFWRATPSKSCIVTRQDRIAINAKYHIRLLFATALLFDRRETRHITPLHYYRLGQVL